MRLNVSVPDALMDQVRADLPDLNVSAVLQRALRDLLECDHEQMVCAACGDDVDVVDIARESMGLLWGELVHAWQPLVDRGGTAEGAARIGKEVAVRMGAAGAERRSLPRPPRTESRRSA